jgi:farnesyl diphosphate synthase
MNHPQFITYKNSFNEILNDYLKKKNTQSDRLNAAIKYSLLNGGKRIRAILVYTTGEIFNTHSQTQNDIALAIEMIHAFSLIHDDLPAMDNDKLRRGKATCHIAYDEATAILAGDALQTLAFEVLSNTPKCNIKNPLKIIEAIKELSISTGSQGMAAGQMLDIESEGKTVTLKELQNIHKLKTGALISASISIPYILSDNYSEKTHKLLKELSLYMGLAFQIQDDILDITSSTKTLGKEVNRDIYLEKSTYPKIIGLDASKSELKKISIQIDNILAQIPQNTEALATVAQYVSNRYF